MKPNLEIGISIGISTENSDPRNLPIAHCSKSSNFFSKTNFLDRLFIKFRHASEIRSFLGVFVIGAIVLGIFWKCGGHIR